MSGVNRTASVRGATKPRRSALPKANPMMDVLTAIDKASSRAIAACIRVVWISLRASMSKLSTLMFPVAITNSLFRWTNSRVGHARLQEPVQTLVTLFALDQFNCWPAFK